MLNNEIFIEGTLDIETGNINIAFIVLQCCKMIQVIYKG